MMGRVTLALSLLLLAGTASAGRTLNVVEEALEAMLNDVTMPSGSAGTVIIEGGCEGCEPRSLRTQSDIRYFERDTQLTHAEFMAEVNGLKGSEAGEQTVVGVYYDRESGRVTRIKLFTSPD